MRFDEQDVPFQLFSSWSAWCPARVSKDSESCARDKVVGHGYQGGTWEDFSPEAPLKTDGIEKNYGFRWVYNGLQHSNSRLVRTHSGRSGLAYRRVLQCKSIIMWVKQCHKPPIWAWFITHLGMVYSTYLWWITGLFIIVQKKHDFLAKCVTS